jgi:type II restriction enzyme
MHLELNSRLAAEFKSRSQIARVITEDWVARNLFCGACIAPSINQSLVNTRAVDFACGTCGALYQLKSATKWSQRIPDAAYDAMIAAIRSDNVPNLLVMQYTTQWQVRNLILVPSFFFTEAAIEKRKPLGETARRAGWVGCNIHLGAIPPEGKVPIVADGVPIDPLRVRQRYRNVRSIGRLEVGLRGWALNVLNSVHQLGSREFKLADVYAFESRLSAIYPNNRNVRAKIRQQLQVLRDLGLIRFLGNGRYSLAWPSRIRVGTPPSRSLTQ